MTTNIAKSSVADFLKQYAKPSDKSRFFTRSQLFIAYRSYLSRIKSSALMTMDYEIFSSEFEEEIKSVQLQTKVFGRSKYYRLFKPDKNLELDKAQVDEGKSGDERKIINIPLNDLNIYLSCKLCCGYLVDATTITECLHSFCKSCIVKHLHFKLSCPICNTAVHSTNPFSSLKSDIVLQDVVNNLLPGIVQSEQQRYDAFTKTAEREGYTPEPFAPPAQRTVTIILEWVGSKAATLPSEDLVQKYIRISEQTTIGHISQFILQKQEKVDKSLTPTMNCDILSGGVPLSPIFTIRDVIENELVFDVKKDVPVFQFDLKPIS